MRVLPAAILTALLATAAQPAAAQNYEDPDLPGVRVTISPRSYLNPGNKVRPHNSADYAKSNLTGNTFKSSNYYGVIGFESYPIYDQLDMPYNGGRYVLRAPDRYK